MTWTISDPIISKLRKGIVGDEFIPITETHTIINGKILLTELPDSFQRVQIDNYTEVNNNNLPLSSNQFLVDYINGIISFNISENNKDLICNYFGRGCQYFPVSRVWTIIENNNVTQTLQEFINEGQIAIEAMEQVGDLQEKIDQANILVIDLEEDITIATSKKSDLETSITNANSTKSSLDTSNTTALETKNNLDSSNTTANTIKTNLDSSISTGDSLKINLDNDISTGNTLHTNLQSDITNGTQLKSNLDISIGNAETIKINLDLSAVDATNINNILNETIETGNTSIQELNDIGTAFSLYENYDPIHNYIPLNKVQYLGSSYENKVACTGILPTSTDYWLLICAKGIDGSITSISSANSDISVANPTTTPELTLNSGTSANQIVKLDNNAQVTADILKDGTNNKVYTSTEKTKLSGISDGANKVESSITNGNIKIDTVETNVYAHPSGDGNLHVPETGTINNNKVLKSGDTAGSATWENVDYSELTNKPTTLSGYGITDAATSDQGVKADTALQSSDTDTASTVNKIVKRDSNGNITGKQIISDVAQGTAPLVVTSTIKVVNLNAEQIDGLDSTDLLQTSQLGQTGGVAKQDDLISHINDNGGIHSPGVLRQAIINDNFDRWQRGTSFTNPSTNAYTADRYFVSYSADGGILPANIIHSRQILTSGDIPNSYYFYRINVDSAGSGFGINSIYRIVQKIENGTKLLCGLNKKLTLSFWARSSITNKKLGIIFTQDYGTGGSPSTLETITGQTFAITSTWTKYTCTITTNTLAGKTFGTDNNDNFRVQIVSLWGTSIASLVGDTVAETFVGAGNIDIAQVQLCAGDVALQFAPKSFGEELLACQRYCYQIDPLIQLPSTSYTTNDIYFWLPVNVPMRIAPTPVFGVEGTDWQLITPSGTVQTGFSLTLVSSSTKGVLIKATKTSHGLTDATLKTLTDINRLDAEL